MPRKLYTEEMKQYLSEIVKGRTNKEIAKKTNEKFGTEFTESQMRSLKTRLRLKSGLPRKRKGQGRITTKEQDKFIHENYKGLYSKQLTDFVNKEFGTNFTVKQIKAYKARNKLSSGIKTTFKKGQVPFNKGMKQSDYMSAEAIERTKNTRFQKGQDPINWQPMGYERITRDGYTEVKVRDEKEVHSTKNFELKHRVLWKKHHGEIPESHIVIFKNGNPQDVRLENLMMVHRGIGAQLNRQGLKSEYPELTEAGVKLIELQFKTNERLEK